MNKNSKNISIDPLLRTEVLPTGWCSGCGIGTIVNVFVKAIEECNILPDAIQVLTTGIGCTSKLPDYLKIQSDVILNECIIDYASRISREFPQKKMILFIDDVDIIASGVVPFIQADIKDSNILIVYFNNYTYRIFVEHRKLEQSTPEKLPSEKSAKSLFKKAILSKWFRRRRLPVKSIGSPFNIPKLAKDLGASYIARWTSHHPRRLMESMIVGLKHKNLSVIEVISPCLMYFTNVGRVGKTLDREEMSQDNIEILNDEPEENLDLRVQEKIIIGEFRNIED